MTENERESITRGFLFADLRGYTDFVESHGAVAAAALLSRYRALAREAIGRFGGAEIKTEGDSFYVVFDSVSGAVRCGLALVAEAAGRVGRASGGADPGRCRHPRRRDGRGSTAGTSGSAVNIAARICAQAGPGEVPGQRDRPRADDDTLLPVTVQVAGSTSAEGHRRADRALRGRGGDDLVIDARAPTVCRVGRAARWPAGDSRWGWPPLIVAIGLASGCCARPPGSRPGTWTIGRRTSR